MTLTIASVELNEKCNSIKNIKESIVYKYAFFSRKQFYELRCCLARLIGWNFYEIEQSIYTPLNNFGLRKIETKNNDVLHKFFGVNDKNFTFDNEECKKLLSAFNNRNINTDERIIGISKYKKEEISFCYEKIIDVLKSAIDNNGLIIGYR